MIVEAVLALLLAQTATTTATRQLQQIEDRLAATWQDRDCDGWGAMMAPDWSVIHVTGDIITKQQALAMCKAPRPVVETYRIDDLSIRLFDGAAVVTGRTTAMTGGKKPQSLTLRFTDVFVRQGDTWQVVASHATRVGS